jgi:hypothetical protein
LSKKDGEKSERREDGGELVKDAKLEEELER